MKRTNWHARTRQELIIEVWEALDCESVGEPELLFIQNELQNAFGEGAVMSPAAIARELADEGAVLRHPEILSCDTRWRERQLSDVFAGELSFASLSASKDSLDAIGKTYSSAAAKGDQSKLKGLKDLISQSRQQVQLVSRSKIVSEQERLIAREVVQWLTVWLEQPTLFPDWLALRERSADYRKQFG